MSGGRAILGLGAGDSVSKAEHEAFGIPFASAPDRVALLAETAAALRLLFAGAPWPGGSHVPAIAGPLLPPGQPELWIGGRSHEVIATAARSADAWNGWAMDADRSRRAPPSSAGSPTGDRSLPPGAASCSSAPIPLTWNGSGRSGSRQGAVDGRLARGRCGDLRAFADRLRDAGCSWIVVLPVGGEDRLELVAEALRG